MISTEIFWKIRVESMADILLLDIFADDSNYSLNKLENRKLFFQLASYWS